jgi:hypothetical protein
MVHPRRGVHAPLTIEISSATTAILGGKPGFVLRRHDRPFFHLLNFGNGRNRTARLCNPSYCKIHVVPEAALGPGKKDKLIRRESGR